MRAGLWMLVLTGVLVSAGGCSVEKAGPADATEEGNAADSGTDAPFPGEVPDVHELHDAERQDSDVLQPSQLCPQSDPITGQVALLPRPFLVFEWGGEPEEIEANLSWEGGELAQDIELGRLASARGLDLIGERAGAYGGLHVVFHPEEEWSALVGSCGFQPGELPGAYFLAVSADELMAVAHVFSPDADGTFYALKTLRQLVSAEGAHVKVRAAVVFDRPALRLRGLLEAFYGDPWTREDRLAMLEEAANLKLNYYLYAPKGDLAITIGWMVPFSQDELAHFAQVTQEAERNHMRVCLELHPSWNFHYSSEADLMTAIDKFASVVEVGVECVVLAFDDQPSVLSPPDDEVFEGYTQAQAEAIPWLGEELVAEFPGLELVFVPTEYYTNHPDAKTALPVLGAALPEEWQIGWTGTEILPRTITLADANDAEALLDRKPFLGDNYPVSDAAQDTGTIYLGPLVGRSPDLYKGLGGIGFNASPLAFASLPGLASGADYAWNPEAYGAQASASNVAGLYGCPQGKDALLALFLANRNELLEDNGAPELAAAIDAFWQAWELARKPAGDATALGTASTTLRTGFFEIYASAASVLSPQCLYSPVEKEVLPWIELLSAYGDAGMLALELLTDKSSGRPRPPEDLTALSEQVVTLAQSPVHTTGDIMDDFLARAVVELTSSN